MARKYKYTVLIRFGNQSTNSLLFSDDIPYPNSHNSLYKDSVLIKDKSIKIITNRSNKFNLESIFDNPNTAIVQQVTKCLTYYYCATGRSSQISSIVVRRYLNNKLQEKFVFAKDKISQITPSSSSISVLSSLDMTECKVLFDESDKSRSILYTLTHLIRALCLTEPFVSFENTWKSFNALYKEKEQSNQDKTCLQNLRQHMVANPNDYPISTLSVTGKTRGDIFKNVNWRRMILNDFPTHTARAEAFRGFVTRQNDVRIIDHINETLTLREDHLKSYMPDYTTVLAHISTVRANNTITDIEVVAFICLKYLYFQRNKIMHAERVDSSFHIVKNNSEEERRIKECNTILMNLIIDLVNFNSRF